MGNFIDMAAVLAPKARVADYLATHQKDEPAKCVATMPDRTLVIYDEATGDFDRIQQLSQGLSAVVFALHIHDDDLWMYELLVNGNPVDQFNADPHYWKKLSAAEAATWKGRPGVIVAHWPGVSSPQINRYLRSREETEADGDEKAYPDDEFGANDCWQVCDFLRRLGTPYPG